mgnify:CR=1 FL=1
MPLIPQQSTLFDAFKGRLPRVDEGNASIIYLKLPKPRPELVSSCYWRLPKKERDAARLLGPEKQDAFVLCHYLLHEILYFYTREILVIDLDNFKKPFLINSPFQFNISHSGDWLMVGISMSPIGVDIEQVKDIPERNLIEKYYFSDQYFENARHVPPAEAVTFFYQEWVRIEAILKAHGVGLLDVESLKMDDLLKVESVSNIQKPIGNSDRYVSCAAILNKNIDLHTTIIEDVFRWVSRV